MRNAQFSRTTYAARIAGSRHARIAHTRICFLSVAARIKDVDDDDDDGDDDDRRQTEARIEY